MAKPIKQAPAGIPIQGRNAAYVARNRADLIEAASEVFARIGHGATVEEIAAHAGVSVSTIYSHFPSKQDLFKTFSFESFMKWQSWVSAKVSPLDDPLVEFVTIPRLLMRQRETHPMYAEAARKSFEQMNANRSALTEKMRESAMTLLKAGLLSMDHPAIRLENYAACIFATYEKYLMDEKVTSEDCDIALEIALQLLGISPAQAKKLAHGKLPDLSR